jgi:DNA-directed RNA polymerase subunit H (RpoH/RPB5)
MPTMGSALTYRIVVRGAVSPRLAETIECVNASDQETVMTAEVVDQSQLHGILERLRDLGIELVRIETISGPGARI